MLNVNESDVTIQCLKVNLQHSLDNLPLAKHLKGIFCLCDLNLHSLQTKTSSVLGQKPYTKEKKHS